jgi:hypothetical protein
MEMSKADDPRLCKASRVRSMMLSSRDKEEITEDD